MSDFFGVIAVLAGFSVRLAVPVLITILFVRFLRGLDERWQSEASNPPAPPEKLACWEIKQCPPELQKECPGFTSPFPCWQAFRLPNGYLREECLACKVFLGTPAPGIA